MRTEWLSLEALSGPTAPSTGGPMGTLTGRIMRDLHTFCGILLVGVLPLSRVGAQDRNPFSTPRAETKPGSSATFGRADSAGEGTFDAESRRVGTEFKGLDSVVYRLAPGSRLLVKTGKAGLFGFAGHSHVIWARRFTGRVVYYPNSPPSSHLDIAVPPDSLE